MGLTKLAVLFAVIALSLAQDYSASLGERGTSYEKSIPGSYHRGHGGQGRGDGGRGYGKGDEQVKEESKYYYGGQFKDKCQGDGLYYKDDTAFVMCSNGYPHEQRCPPGTKTAGHPSYKAGYYYGYTDLCSVNLVDYGFGPEHYAPTAVDGVEGDGKKEQTVDRPTGYGKKDVTLSDYKDKDYNNEVKNNYNRKNDDSTYPSKGRDASYGPYTIAAEYPRKDSYSSPGAYSDFTDGDYRPAAEYPAYGGGYPSINPYASRDAGYPQRVPSY